MIHSCIKLFFYDNIMTLSDLAEFVNNISAKPRPGTTGGGGETGLATVGRFGRNDIIYCGIIFCLYFWLLKLWIMTPVHIILCHLLWLEYKADWQSHGLEFKQIRLFNFGELIKMLINVFFIIHLYSESLFPWILNFVFLCCTRNIIELLFD